MHPTRIGPYPVEREVGRGGMGVVYRARDPRLDRPVAIKVLPDEFARDPERLARFEREARLLAALIHPNIAAIHGLEEADGRRFLVLEYVDGQTLAERLAGGPLSIAETLEVARQVAAALEAAHEAGIIHRDLKPGNVKINEKGEVKVLDFGLARGGDGTGADSDAGNSPTLSLAATGAGVILGTAAYMSPEQARGKRVDRRTDIWSFGALLYECLTGKQAFPGETVSDSIARILQSEPDPAPLPAELPPRLRALLARCLEKDAKRRLRDIGDARIELEEMLGLAPSSPRLGHDSSRIGTAATVPGTTPVAAIGRSRLLALAGAALAGALLAIIGGRLLAPSAAPRPPLRYTIPAPAGTVLSSDPCMIALSPDGRRLAFVAFDSTGAPNLWLRPLDGFEATKLPGTEGAMIPFWSPDGRSVAFFSMGKLRRTSLGQGSPEPICDAPNPRGGSWGAKDVIVFAPTAVGPLYRVDARGGTPVATTVLDSTLGETAHRWPSFLPDGERFLYASLPIRQDRFHTWCGALGSMEHEPVVSGRGGATFAPPGHLIYELNAKLVAQPFDPGRRKVTGEPFVIGEPPARTSFSASHAGSASETGTFAWITGALEMRRLAYLSPDGAVLGTPRIPDRPWEQLSISPDGRFALVDEATASGATDLWLIDLERGTSTRVTAGGENATPGPFLPDSKSFLFTSTRSGTRAFYRRRIDGLGGDSLVYTSPVPFKSIRAVTADGQAFIFEQVSGDSAWDICLGRFGSSDVRPIVATPASENASELSPDGRWLLWQSDASGANEVYVAAFPNLEHKHQVSRGTNSPGLWSHDGREIWFAQTGAMIAAFDPATGEVSAPRQAGRIDVDVYAAASLPHRRGLLAILNPARTPSVISIAVDWKSAERAVDANSPKR